MPEKDKFLYVEAHDIDKTYIGGTFCPGEEELKGIFQRGFSSLAQDIQFAQEAVQQGMEPDTAMEKFNLNITPDSDVTAAGNKKIGEPVSDCLGKIASGLCAVYPRG